MNSKFFMLAASLALSHAAFAQTSTTVTAPAAATTNSNTATTAIPGSEVVGVAPLLKYTGYFFGPGADFSGMQKDGSLYGTQHRVTVGAHVNPNIDLGLQTRLKTQFGSGSQTRAYTGDFRVTSNFKNVYKDDVYNLSLQPRILLPTSDASRNEKVTLSPDLIAEFTIAPKNSRLSFDTGFEYIHYFHTDGATGDDYSKAMTGQMAPWIEADYQLTEKTQLMVSYWPIWNSYARQGSGLSTAGSAGGSNEIDIGGYYEFVKGWQLNPYVAVEMNDMGVQNSYGKNLQLNLIVLGAIL